MKYTDLILRNPDVDTEYRTGYYLKNNVQNGEDIPLNSYHQIMTFIENIGMKIKKED